MKLGLARRGFSGTGGAEAYLRRFAEAAREAGHECVLFASGEWPDSAWQGDAVRIGGRSPRAFADNLLTAHPHEHCDVLFSLERVWECDVYRAGDGVHASWMERRGGSWWQRTVRRLQRKHREMMALERALFTTGARCIIANSAMVRDEIILRFGTPPERVRVIHNGVPAWHEEPGLRQRTRERLGLGPDDYTLLFAGSGWERKGLRFALRAMNRVPGARLLVAGRGKTRGQPVCEAATYLGPQTGAEMQALWAAADAFVLPTLYEPFSNACLEALAAGLPVISTAANGFSEIIEHGVEGEAVANPSDIPALAAAIEAWRPAEKRAAVQAALRAKGARFSVEQNLRQTLTVLETVAPAQAAG